MTASAYYAQVQNLYVAYFGRPADKLGLEYYAKLLAANGGNDKAMLHDFANSAESKALYNQASLSGKIASMYQTLFGREGDLEGIAYWASEVQLGNVILSEVAAAIAYNAQEADKAAFAAKLTAADAFTAKIDTTAELVAYETNPAQGRTWLASVKDAASATAATATIDATLTAIVSGTETNAGQTFTLTAGVDTFTGTAGADTFNASNVGGATPVTVTGGLDVVDGGDGVDTLNVVDTVVAAGAAFNLGGMTIKNIEKLNATTNGSFGNVAGAVVFDVSTIAGLQSVNLVGAGTLNSNVKAAATTDVQLTTNVAASATVNGGKAVTVNKAAGATINDAIGQTGTTLKAVRLDSVDGDSTLTGNGINTVTLAGATAATRTVTVSNATVDHTLALNVVGTGIDSASAISAFLAGGTIVTDAAATTININAVGTKSSVALTGSTAVKTINVTGDAALTLNANLGNVTKIDGSTATGNLTLGTINAATTTVKTGAGKDSFTLGAAKVTVDTGAGDDTVTLSGEIAVGSNIVLGAGNDKLLNAGGSVAAPTTTLSTTIDAGDGFDTVSASLITAANAAQFKNFEALDLSAAATLDVALMTGSTVTDLTLSGRTGTATIASTVANVATGVSLKVSGNNDNLNGGGTSAGSSTTIGVKGAATNLADSFAIKFDGAAATTAPTAANIKAGSVVLANVEDISIASTGAANTWNSIALTADKLQTLTITGDKNLDLTFGNSGTNSLVSPFGGAVKSIDGSAATGKLSINTTNVTADNKAGVGLTVKGGSADDTITLGQKATVIAGAGNDTIVTAAAGGTLTGGEGKDVFNVTLSAVADVDVANSTSAVVVTITDFATGDTIKLGGATQTFKTAKVALDNTVTDLNGAVALAIAATETVSWFQYGADTYIVRDVGTAGLDVNDIVVKLTGLIDLSGATLSATGDLAFA